MDETSRLNELRRALTECDATAFLVEPRVIRRVIRDRHGYARLSTSIPHTESQVVSDSDLRALTHPDELGLQTFQTLPSTALLIAQPEEGELDHWPIQELLQLIWRRLFHGTIDRELLQKTRGPLNRGEVQNRIAAIGQVEFDEAHFVLKSEHRLVDSQSRIEGYCEFAAIYLELQRFAPDLLPVWFPSLDGRIHVNEVIANDLDADAIFRATQLVGAPSPDLTPRQIRDEERLTSTRQDWSLGVGSSPSDRAYLRQMKRRDRALERGNTVGAMTCAMRAAERATTEEKRTSAHQKARLDIEQLILRLRAALQFDEAEVEDWRASIWELATNSIHGFWNADKRLLFDLQKVCLDHERVIYRVDLVKWLVSRGSRPLRRSLTTIREVMMAKHLASSASRLVNVRLSGSERERLYGLLHEAAHLAEEQMRERMRPAVRQTLIGVGLQPDNLPDQVAFDKLIEDSLDCVAERGYLTMGYLRDSISRNDLKLPDLKYASELIRGDHLLRADDQLDVSMDGVYRRGEFYLRWLQITSSMFFGTPMGRFATLFLIIPFGGAKIIVVGVEHIIHLFTGKGRHQAGAPSDAADPAEPLQGDEDSGAGSDSDAAEPAAEVQEASVRIPANDASPDAFGGNSRSAEVMGATSSELVGKSQTENSSLQTSRTEATISDDNDASSVVGTSGERPDPEFASRFRLDGADLDVDQAIPTVLVQEASSDPVRDVIAKEVSSLSLVLAVGLVLMGLIHVPTFRQYTVRILKRVWKLVHRVAIDWPARILQLPFVQMLWRNRTFVRIRRVFISPFLISLAFCQWLPWLFGLQPRNWWWVTVIGALLSLALNSRLGRDAEELTAEWLANLWYNFHARVLMAVIDWIIDFFKTLLGFVERFLYAVDEWLRFHSAESWFTVVAKAILGVIWSFVSFLIRIYVNLMIEPTFHPVKHFPVVTVAHKMLFPFLLVLDQMMRESLTPYLGGPLAFSVTWFNIFFLPGLFGFAVWELKENWRLYDANREPSLTPSAVGSHGETVPRLMKPGFHSGTLPKLFRRMRRLEQKEASIRRYSLRRAAREQLEHVERDVRRFVDREFIRLLDLCPPWKDFGIACKHVHVASNSIQVQITCRRLGHIPLTLLFQEQSGWAVATIANTGWLRFASSEQTLVLEHALEGFYRKAGIELVREQLCENLIGAHEYDINSVGLAIWPNRLFHREITVDLDRSQTLRPTPATEAATYNLLPIDRQKVVFSDSKTQWATWKEMWQPAIPSGSTETPLASSMPVRIRLIQQDWRP